MTKTYRLADLVDGAYGQVFTSLADAEIALRDAVDEGNKINASHADECEGEIPSAESFIFLVDAETGEEI